MAKKERLIAISNFLIKLFNDNVKNAYNNLYIGSLLFSTFGILAGWLTNANAIYMIYVICFTALIERCGALFIDSAMSDADANIIHEIIRNNVKCKQKRLDLFRRWTITIDSYNIYADFAKLKSEISASDEDCWRVVSEKFMDKFGAGPLITGVATIDNFIDIAYMDAVMNLSKSTKATLPSGCKYNS